MTLRLTLLLLLVAAFAVLFSEVAKRSEGPNAISPCDEWSNPDCMSPSPPQ
jgi:hypothetical protein